LIELNFLIELIGSQILGEDRLFHDTWFSESKLRLLNLIKNYSIPGDFITVIQKN